jgi:methylated-DNA-protein-cysteine methyltransferase related protein
MKRRPASRSNAAEIAFRKAILSVPPGKVASYGEIAEAAGLPLHHRQVARFLHSYGHSLPWHRILGSGGVIKQKGEAALEQRTRLEMEGVRFRGKRVDLSAHQHSFE